MDHMRRKTLKLDKITMVVLDEADEMLNMGFEEDIETILKDIPEGRQTILFSATMNKRILEITKKYLKEPKNVKIKSKELTVDRIEQISLEVKQKMKDEIVMRLIDLNDPKKAVVFCNTKKKVDNLIEKLKNNGYKAECLHGDIKQAQRDRIMKRFKQGEFQILVATDVVARGIDVEELELVINYDIPQEEEYYVHRIGRTGRNGKIGKAYTFVVGKEKSKLLNIQKYANTKIIKGKIPTLEEINKVKNQKIIDNIEEMIEKNEESELAEKVLNKLMENNKLETVAKALINIIINENSSDKECQIDINPDEMVKLFINVGKKDKIMVKDIVGSISANTAISGENIGKINILDKFTFVEIHGKYVNEILNSMKGKQIKGRDVNIEIANS
jgi:ATP-dependent RNA helicase DeaD